MVDYTSEAILIFARGRARWFWPSIAVWLFLTLLSVGHGALATLTCATILAAFIAFWYFATLGKAWPFLIGVILSAISTVVSLVVAQFIPAVIHALVGWRLWDAFVMCSSLDAARSHHAELVKSQPARSRIASAGDGTPSTDAPPPPAWQPFRGPQKEA